MQTSKLRGRNAARPALIEEVVQCAGPMSAQLLVSSDKNLTEMFRINLSATRMLEETMHFAIVTSSLSASESRSVRE